MDRQPLAITILREGDGLLVWLTDGLPVGRPMRIATAAWLPRVLGQAAEIRQSASEGGAGTACGNSERASLWRSVGAELYRQALGPAVRDHLAGAAGRPLVVQLDDELAPIPWEWAFDGDDFLGHKFAVSRQLAGTPPPANGPPIERKVLRILLAGGDAGDRVADHLTLLHRRLAGSVGLAVSLAPTAAVDRDKAQALLAESDIVYGVESIRDEAAAAPGADRLPWAGLESVAVADLARLPGWPRLWILQRRAARGAAAADRLLVAIRQVGTLGASALICDFPGPEEAGEAFPLQFYRQLARGASLGEAVRSARRAASAAGCSSSEALLYGDGAEILLARDRPPPPQDDLRQVTVMFCDIVESSALLSDLRAEKYSTVVTGYHDCCARIVSRFGGSIKRLEGDGFACVFGFPIPHEDAAAQALRAGREILDAVARLGLRVRIGIDTGQVVVREGEPYGGPMHLGKRLEGRAAPGTLLASPATHQVVEGRFTFRQLEAQPPVRGHPEIACLHELVDEIRPGSDDSMAASPQLTPFVGREREFALLRDHWAAARTGASRAVMVCGEAGIGKSRLVSEFRRGLKSEGQVAILGRCTPEHASSAFHPVIDFVRRAAGIQDRDATAVKLDKIAAIVPDVQDAAALVGALLSIPDDPRYPKPDLPADKLRQLTLRVLTEWIQRQARVRPLCMIVEDVHWIDPSTGEFLQQLLRIGPSLALLLVATSRTQAGPTWDPAAPIHRIELEGLSDESVRAMIARNCDEAAFGDAMASLIASRADGVPLFVEESLRMALDLQRSGKAARDPSALEMAIPKRLNGLLTVRLDRLGDAKLVARVGGTIGREFSLDLLEAVLADGDSPVRVDDLPARLRELVESGLILPQRDPARQRFVFKHALVRDAAYQSLLEADRARLHRAIAHVIPQQFPELDEAQPELVAHHHAGAGNRPQAIACWERAARRAASRSAHREALDHLGKGLGALESLPESTDRHRIELRLQLLRAARLIAIEGYGAHEVERAYQRASDLAQSLQDDHALLRAFLGLEGYHFMRAHFAKARQIADQVADVMRRVTDASRGLQARWAVANILFHQGELGSAVERMDQCLAEFGDEKHHPDAVQDVRVMCLCYSAWGLWELGYPDQALRRAHSVVERSTRLGHRFSMAEAFGFRAAVHHFRGENGNARQDADDAIRICEDHGFAVWLAHARLMRGRVLAETGPDADSGVAEMRQAYRMWSATGAVVTTPFYLAMQSEGLALAGRPDEGLDLLEKAIAIVGKYQERYYEPEICRLLGELKLQSAAMRRQDRAAEAEQCYLRGLDLAKVTALRSLELRCATSLARLWGSRGRRREAVSVLQPALDWFVEGERTRDLDCARRVLAGLQ